MEKNRLNKKDLIIVGGGIMGLMTAYYASKFTKNITLLEKSTIGNKQAASFSFTRSIRSDYLDPEYSQLAYEAQGLWKLLEEDSNNKFLFSCGCLNLVKKTVTPKIKNTYAIMSYENEKSINLPTRKFGKKELMKRFPQFNADLACLDIEAGFLYLPLITNFILSKLKNNVEIIENVDITNIIENKEIKIQTNIGTFKTENLLVTAALGTNDVIKKIKKNNLILPIFPDKPQECKYIYIPKNKQKLFSPERFPVFAYLDVGIYGHPIFDKKRSCIKIGFYNPPDMSRKLNKKINSIDSFINECLPVLKNADREIVRDADQCFYDMVEDDNFILGKLPGYKNIFIGCGWRGTGYKFSPLIGKILTQLSIQKGTIYDIKRFSPERFIK